MEDVLTNPLIVSIAGGALAVVSAFLGFTYRSIRTYSKPVVRVLGFDNEHTSAPDTISFDPSYVSLLKSIRSGVFDERTSSIENLKRKHKVLSAYESAAKGFLDDVDKFAKLVAEPETLDGVLSGDIIKALKAVCGYYTFDLMLLSGVGKGWLKIPIPSADKEPVLKVLRGQSNDGCYIAYLPEPITIGSGLNSEPANEHYYQDFATILANAEYSKLASIFRQLAESLQKDLPTIKDATKLASDIIASYSVYTAQLYVANLTMAPILIEPDAQLVLDGVRTKRGPLQVSMKLARFEETGGGRRPFVVQDAVVIPAGKDDRLLAFTPSASQIEDGGVVQALFSKGGAMAGVRLSAEFIGYPRRRYLTTPRRRFASVTSEDQEPRP